jgi:hypothetical protein
MDNEILNLDKEFEKTVTSLGWDEVVRRFNEKCKALDSIAGIDAKLDAEHVKLQVLANQEAKRLITETLNSIESEAKFIKHKRTDYS